MRLVLATGNAGKLRELEVLLAGLPLELIAQRDLGVSEIAETGASFYDNALLKARHARDSTGLAALAEDSGLEVDALGGAPGVLSARYAAADGARGANQDLANNAKLVAALAATPTLARTACYRCVAVLLRSEADAEPLVAQGEWRGLIIDTPRGTGGFGYDPHFWLPDLQKTAAQLSVAEKNRLSHRGQALRALRSRL
jgi:XTP/dITP diphosphohydrolase